MRKTEKELATKTFSPRESRGMAVSLALSVGVHVAILAGCSFFLSGYFQPPVFLERALQLNLLRPVPENIADPSPVSAVRETEKKKISPLPAKNVLSAERKPDPDQLKIDQKIESIRQKLERAVQKAPAAVLASESQGFEIVSGVLSGPVWDGYVGKIRKKVLEQWYPLLIEAEGKLVKSEVRIDFSLDQSGRVIRYGVVEWKGVKRFCDLSLKSFERALPFDPLPFSEAGKDDQAQPLTLSLFFYYQ